MEGGELKLAEFKLPADRPEAENSYWPPDNKQIWWSDISGGAPDKLRALPLGGQEPFDILEFLFHSNSSPFAHVLSLCFKTLRVAMRKVSLLQPLGKKLMQFNFRLDCMPAAPFDMEKMSMLDWYFDCEGEQWSLRGLLTRDPSAALSAMKGAAAVKGAAAGGASATNPKLASNPKASATAAPAGSPPQKPERHTKANTADAGNVSIYHRFQGFLQVFRETIHKVRLEAPAETPGQGAAAVDGENFIWHRKDAFGLDSIVKPNVWLGLGRLEDGFRKPVAIKKNDEAEDSLRLKRIMRKLKPGSFIASAELVELEPLSMEVDEKQREDQTPKAQQMQKRWVSEAGVCTLEDIFGHSFPPNYDEERRTKAHRMLVREILHSMALAVYHLHECNIAHGTINLKYFKFFLIEEPPRSTNLRVKLVSMRRADILSPERQRADIQALGNAMARVVLGTQSSDMELLLPYDPSLYHLITWILQTDGDGATLADVVRHPYFMSLNEKEAFTLALEGGVFGQVATTADLDRALAPLTSKQLLPFIDSLFVQLRAVRP